MYRIYEAKGALPFHVYAKTLNGVKITRRFKDEAQAREYIKGIPYRDEIVEEFTAFRIVNN